MKKTILKKSICLFFAGVLALSTTACMGTPNTSTGNGTGGKPVKPPKPADQVAQFGNPLFDGVSSAPYTTEDYTFTTIFVDGEEKQLPQYDAVDIQANEFVVYDINSNIKDKN